MSDEQTIKVGDRFEIVVEVVKANSLGDLHADHVIHQCTVPSADSDHLNTEIPIYQGSLLSGKRLPPVLKVGMRARWNGGTEGTIIAIDDGRAWFKSGSSRWDLPIIDLEPAS